MDTPVLPLVLNPNLDRNHNRFAGDAAPVLSNHG